MAWDSQLYLFCPGAKGFALGLPAAPFWWPGALSDLPCPSPLEDGGEFDGEDDGLVADDQAPPLLALLLPELWLALDTFASLILLDALLNAPDIAPLSAPTATTRLPTSKSKRTAYSGAEMPASSFAMWRNILVLEPPITRYDRVVVPGSEKAIFGDAVSR